MNKIQLRTILFAVLLSIFTGAAHDASAQDCTQKFVGAWRVMPSDGVPVLIGPDHVVRDSKGRGSQVHMSWSCNGNVVRMWSGDFVTVGTLSPDGNRMDGFST